SREKVAVTNSGIRFPHSLSPTPRRTGGEFPREGEARPTQQQDPARTSLALPNSRPFLREAVLRRRLGRYAVGPTGRRGRGQRLGRYAEPLTGSRARGQRLGRYAEPLTGSRALVLAFRRYAEPLTG